MQKGYIKDGIKMGFRRFSNVPLPDHSVESGEGLNPPGI